MHHVIAIRVESIRLLECLLGLRGLPEQLFDEAGPLLFIFSRVSLVQQIWLEERYCFGVDLGQDFGDQVFHHALILERRSTPTISERGF